MKKVIAAVKRIVAKLFPKKVSREEAIAEMQRQLKIKREELR